MAKRFAFYSLNFANDVKAFDMIPFKSSFAHGRQKGGRVSLS